MRVIPFEESHRVLSNLGEIEDLEDVIVIYTRKNTKELYFQSSVSDSATLTFWLTQVLHGVIKRAQ